MVKYNIPRIFVVYFRYEYCGMISFKHKSQVKQVKIKTKRQLNERMSSWLQSLFGLKNPIVGFKTQGSKYFDADSFYHHISKFFGQQVDIIEAGDQLQISFYSDNLNSSSFIKHNANYQHDNRDAYRENHYEEHNNNRNDHSDEDFKIVQDVKSFEKKLPDSLDLTILFVIDPVHRKEIAESINFMKSLASYRINWALKLQQTRQDVQPTYSIYAGKRLIVNLNLTREYKETIQMVIERYKLKLRKLPEGAEKGEERDAQFFRQDIEQENEAPSFTTYQLQQRLSQQACQDYLARMFRERMLKKYQYLKLAQKCDDNFVEFYRIFCEGALDNDYESFKNEILHKVDNNLELLLSNVDEMDLSRPISREEQRRQNLKKSVPNIEIVKVENYFEILDQIKVFLTPYVTTEIKNKLLNENPSVCSYFSDYLSRKVSQNQLVELLEKSVADGNGRPVSRCLPRSAARMKEQDEGDFFMPMNPVPIIATLSSKPTGAGFDQVLPAVLKQQKQQEPSQLIKLMGGQKNSDRKEEGKNETKQIPPMFGSSKQESNFSPIKYMSDIESNYKQAWDRLESKQDLFEPEEYGLLYHYLHTRDDSISNHIQELEWNEQSSIEKLKDFLCSRMIEIMQQNFTMRELDLIAEMRGSPAFECVYQNFKFESNLNNFLESLKSEIAMLSSRKASPRSPIVLRSEHHQMMTKKSSDSQLLDNKYRDKKKGEGRKYSDEHEEDLRSPKSSFSHSKTVDNNFNNLWFTRHLWTQQFEEMLNYVNFSEQRKEEYLRSAFKEKNPSLFVWVHQYIQGDLKVIDKRELKNSLRIYENENKNLLKVAPIFNQILRFLEEEGKVSTRMRKWCLSEFLEPNEVVVSIFEHFLFAKDEKEFIENLEIVYELQNNEMEFYRNYLKRIEDILKSMSAHDEVGVELFRLYPQQIKGLCELYYMNGDIDELLESLHTIHSVETNKRKLKVASLNFSGINLSPFEYQDGSEEFKAIDGKMKLIIDKEGANFKDVKLSKIDKNYSTKNLMSVRFGTKMCDGGKLLNKTQYLAQWKNYLRQNAAEIAQGLQEVEIDKMAIFEYYCYASVVAYLYELNWNEEYELQEVEDKDSGKLKEFLQLMFKRPASQINVKSQMVLQYFMKNDVDVLFLQEADNIDWGEELLPEYGWTRNGASSILYRKDKIGKPKTNLHEEYCKKLNFNNDSVSFFSDRGYLLLSVHLTSRPERIEQARDLFLALEELVTAHPMLRVIVGANCSQYLAADKNNFLNTVPDTPDEQTSTKMRTYLQAQLSKAGQYTSLVKDHLFSTLPFKEHSIDLIDGSRAVREDLLPNNRHPFDHYLVVGLL